MFVQIGRLQPVSVRFQTMLCGRFQQIASPAAIPRNTTIQSQHLQRHEPAIVAQHHGQGKRNMREPEVAANRGMKAPQQRAQVIEGTDFQDAGPRRATMVNRPFMITAPLF